MRKRRADPRRLLIDAIYRARLAQTEVRRAKTRLRSLPSKPPEVGRLLVSLEVLELALEAVVIRLETMLAANVFSGGLLALPVAILEELGEYARGLPPALADAIGGVEDALRSLAAMPQVSEDVALHRDEAREEARKILEEAAEAAKRRMEEAPA